MKSRANTTKVISNTLKVKEQSHCKVNAVKTRNKTKLEKKCIEIVDKICNDFFS